METVQKHPIAKGLFYALIVCASIQLFGVLAYISAWILPDKLISTIFFVMNFIPLDKIVLYILLYNSLPLVILTIITWCNRQRLETVLKNPKRIRVISVLSIIVITITVCIFIANILIIPSYLDRLHPFNRLNYKYYSDYWECHGDHFCPSSNWLINHAVEDILK